MNVGGRCVSALPVVVLIMGYGELGGLESRWTVLTTETQDG